MTVTGSDSVTVCCGWVGGWVFVCGLALQVIVSTVPNKKDGVGKS